MKTRLTTRYVTCNILSGLSPSTQDMHFAQLFQAPLLTSPSLVFFFQAEDGIRDRNVTGVQTCALPILRRDERAWPLLLRGALRHPRRPAHRRRGRDPVARHAAVVQRQGRAHRLLVDRGVRSEERRVGKGGRSGWAAD